MQPFLSSSPQPHIESFFDAVTGTVSYVVYDAPYGHAAIIDPVWDFDPQAGATQTTGIDRLIAFVQAQQLTLDWILETHAHADHLSAAQYVKQQLGGRVAIGAHIREVQQVFQGVFNLEHDFACDGSQFDYLFTEGEQFQIGALTCEAMFVPGHTPADMAYRMGNTVFVGDTLFMPDVGTARCDFPGGDAHVLYRSIRKLLALPPETELLMCHDYPPTERAPAWQCSVGEQRLRNIHVMDGIDEASFVAMRQARDAGLDKPRLLFASIQVNIRAGHLPPAERNGTIYLKMPVHIG
jgi:glyoxylase-like metal-dependent hydrolase (beta-lactamase superfamily II)